MTVGLGGSRWFGTAAITRSSTMAMLLPLAVAGCVSNPPSVGGGSATPVVGAAAGAKASAAAPKLERCERPLGVIRIEEDVRAEWYRAFGARLGSTSPVLNLLIMQSNCFLVVERGLSERTINNETQRGRGDEARDSDTRGKGQQVVADYLLKPEITMNNKNNQGAAFGGLFPKAGLLSKIGTKSSEVGTVLTLVDIRSTVRIAAAEGYSKKSSYVIAGLAAGGGGAGGGNAYSTTDEGKLIASAFFDAFNKMVVALRQYKAQTVKDGLGEGGTLAVQGGSTPAAAVIETAKD